MKLFSALLLFLFLSTATFSQEKDKVVLINDVQVIDSNTEIFPLTIVEQAPAFPNCKGIAVEKSHECFQTELMNHLKKNFKYPELALENNIQGKFIAKFVIDENGSVFIQEIVGPNEAEILKEEVKNWFELDEPVPFMEKVFPIRKEKQSEIPAVTHADGSGRLQSVDAAVSPRYHALISEFFKQTGVPILLNTSFNENEPIVNAPAEAIDCYLRTSMDMLVMENIVISRN